MPSNFRLTDDTITIPSDDMIDAMRLAAHSLRSPNQTIENWQENLYNTRQEIEQADMGSFTRDPARSFIYLLERHAHTCNKFNGYVLVPRGRREHIDEVMTVKCLCGKNYTEDFRRLDMASGRHSRSGVQEEILKINLDALPRGVAAFYEDFLALQKKEELKEKKRLKKQAEKENKKAKEKKESFDLIDSLGEDEIYLVE